MARFYRLLWVTFSYVAKNSDHAWSTPRLPELKSLCLAKSTILQPKNPQMQGSSSISANHSQLQPKALDLTPTKPSLKAMPDHPSCSIKMKIHLNFVGYPKNLSAVSTAANVPALQGTALTKHGASPFQNPLAPAFTQISRAAFTARPWNRESFPNPSL